MSLPSPLRSFAPLLVAGFAAVVAARCSGGGGGDVAPLPICGADLTPWAGTGTGSKAIVATAADLLKGDASNGRPGDYVLSNDRIRVVIEAPGRVIGPQPYGGNIIDADLVRADGTSNDQFGELGLLFQFGRTVDVERVEILRDGSAGGAAIIAATGRDAVLDFVNLPGMLAQIAPDIHTPDPDKEMKLRVTTYYVLEPGSSVVRVASAFCNDSSDLLVLPVGDLIDSGGKVQIVRGRGGWGGSVGTGGISGAIGPTEGEPFAAWVGDDVTYGYFPPEDRNQLLTISGVTATLLGAKSLLSWTGTITSPPDGAVILDVGEKTIVERGFGVFDEPGKAYAHYYASRERSVGTAKGRVSREGGGTLGAVRLAFVQGEKLVSTATTGADGSFSVQVPPGETSVTADDLQTRSPPIVVQVTAGHESAVSPILPATGSLVVEAKDAAGEPSPFKLTVVCDGPCARSATGAAAQLFRDAELDALPAHEGAEVAAQAYVDARGTVTQQLAPGKYAVYVSRGPEWSLHRSDVVVTGGQQAKVVATLHHVVDSVGWMSGDFHVHAINSPDSPISNVDRLTSFLAEGVDVIVSTDHDYVTDFRPFLKQVTGGERLLKAITGVELTTFDYGHYNGFPLVADLTKRNGGAPDWAVSKGSSLTPGQIFEALHAYPGDQVVQINHSRGGFLSAIQIDTRTFWTRGDPRSFRIAGIEADTATGDTRLFDDRFTAMEVQNGFGDKGYHQLMNDWFAMLQRGLRRTATAVSDTHKLTGNAGHPRTFVKTATDDPRALDEQAFAKAINEGRAFGTNAPLILAKATAASVSAGLGDTLASNGGEVTLDVELRMPEWVQVEKAFVYVNTPGTATDAKGDVSEVLPPPQATLALDSKVIGDADGVPGYRRQTAQWKFTPTKDAWIVVVIEGGSDLFPVIGKGGVTPRGFTNPIYVDVDGNGWKSPIDLAAERARIGKVGGVDPQPLRRPTTEAELREILERDPCETR